MDYRNRRYCLISVPVNFANNLDIIIKGVLPNCKIHKLKSDKPYNWIKVFIGCEADKYNILENLLRTIPKITSSYYPYRICRDVKFREITETDLGQ